MREILTLLMGVGGGTVASVIGAVLLRKKTKAEVERLKAEAVLTKAEAIRVAADAADTLSQGAVRLVPYYEKRITNLETRLSAAEAAATTAMTEAVIARRNEESCHARLLIVEKQLQELMTGTRTTESVVTTVTNEHISTHPNGEVTAQE